MQKKQSPFLQGCYGKTEHTEGLFLTGTVFYRQQRLTAVSLLALLRDAVSTDKLMQLLQNLEGFFSLIWQQEAQLLLASDRLRSRPLFYCYNADGGWLVAEQPDALVGHSPGLNTEAVNAFEQLGYVPGSATLYSGIFQLQAAELVLLRDGCAEVQRRHYYWFLPANVSVSVTADVSTQLHSELDQTLLKVTQRLIDYAAGRTIVLPLSGGYDSRALALYLYKLGYPKVVTFTFGKPSSREVAYSKRVAESLGFPWFFVPYSQKLWRRVMRSEHFCRYLQFCHHGVSVPNIQVYPALAHLFAQGDIPPDALLVPGHTGDFVSGGHLPAKPEQAKTIDALLIAVRTRHFVYGKSCDGNVLSALRRQLQADLNVALERQVHPVSVAECWNWRERQAKFIVNSNRYYDYFQLDWWMPLWDLPMLEFWQQVPLQQRQHKTLWTSFIDTQMRMVVGMHAVQGNAADLQPGWRGRLNRALNYFTDPNGLYAFVPFTVWLKFRLGLSKQYVTPFSQLSKKMLNFTSNSWSEHR